MRVHGEGVAWVEKTLLHITWVRYHTMISRSAPLLLSCVMEANDKDQFQTKGLTFFSPLKTIPCTESLKVN